LKRRYSKNGRESSGKKWAEGKGASIGTALAARTHRRPMKKKGGGRPGRIKVSQKKRSLMGKEGTSRLEGGRGKKPSPHLSENLASFWKKKMWVWKRLSTKTIKRRKGMPETPKLYPERTKEYSELCVWWGSLMAGGEQL